MRVYYCLLLLLLCLTFILSEYGTSIGKKNGKKNKKKKKKSKLNMPKKYKSLADRSLYCSVCNSLLIEAEKLLSEDKDAKYEYSNYGHRIDSTGKRIKKGDTINDESVYSTHTVLPFIEEVSKYCDKWSKQTGTEHRDDGTVHMVQTNNITGTKGRLNIGDGSGPKISSMCHDIISKFDEDMIQVIRENNLNNLFTFCDKMIDPLNTQQHVCQNAEIPYYIIKHIQSINQFKQQNQQAKDTKVEL